MCRKLCNVHQELHLSTQGLASVTQKMLRISRSLLLLWKLKSLSGPSVTSGRCHLSASLKQSQALSAAVRGSQTRLHAHLRFRKSERHDFDIIQYYSSLTCNC